MLMNIEQRQVAADPQTKSTNLGCESACRLLSTTSTIAIYVRCKLLSQFLGVELVKLSNQSAIDFFNECGWLLYQFTRVVLALGL